jgi:hypothetical protein
MRAVVTNLAMNRLLIGILCGIAFGIADALMVVFGSHPDRTTSVILQAFFSRFAIGVLGANVSFRIHPALSGAIVGLLISLPDAFAMKSYLGILGTGLLFGAMTGWAAMTWAR